MIDYMTCQVLKLFPSINQRPKEPPELCIALIRKIVFLITQPSTMLDSDCIIYHCPGQPIIQIYAVVSFLQKHTQVRS